MEAVKLAMAQANKETELLRKVMKKRERKEQKKRANSEADGPQTKSGN